MKRFVKSLAFIFCVFFVFNFTACEINLASENPVTCTVTYETEHGTAPTAITVNKDTVLTETQLPELTSTGYNFLGWYDGETKAQAGKYKVQNDVTLVAGWELDPSYIKYTIEFNSMGGSNVQSQTVTNGQKAASPDNPTKAAIDSESYSFAGWYTSTDEGETLSAKAFDFNTPITSDIKLYAKWNATPITYTVSFNSKGGSNVTSQIITGGQKAARPDDPTKTAIVSESYIFAGWYTSTDEGNTLSVSVFDFDTAITSDITLYAKWTSSSFTYTVSFNSKGGSPVTTQTVTGGQTVTKPADPTKTAIVSESYSFGGWYTSTDEGVTLSADAFNFATPITSDIKLYAKWNITPFTYTVSFNSKGGSPVTSQVITYGQKAERPGDPNKTATVSESYSFAGWYTSSDEGVTLSPDAFNFATPITSDIKLYAKWNTTPITYTVSFNSKGGSPVTSQVITGGQKATRPDDPTKTPIVSESYIFAGWYTSTDEGVTLSTTAFDFNTPITSNIKLYAKWNVTPITYTVSFNSKGGTPVSSQTITGGQKVTRPADSTKTAIVSESYSFAGWFTSTNEGVTLSTDAFNFDTPITSDIKLYAKWNVIPVTHTVSFNTTGGSPVTSQIITYGQKAERPEDPTKTATVSESYSFVDWYTSSDEGVTLSTTAFDFNTPITSSITLYAKWNVTSITHTVSFITLGGSPVPSQTIIGGQKAERPDDPTRAATASESYSFEGWYTSTDEGVTLSTNAFDFNTPITSSITLYAKWTSPGLIPLTFEFIYDGSITITNPWSTLKYSINGGTLNAYTNEITVNARDKVCLFAQNSENTLSRYMKINCSADCYIYGNIMSLVTMDEQDNWNPEESNVCEYAFYNLFYNNEHILNHNEKELYLPATTLAKSCYSGMFNRCTSLTIAPNITATTVAKACCENMFYRCSSLTTAPFLPATILEENCYAYMFYDCTSLTIVPSLPATTLADYSYRYMFCGCKSLTTTPSIAAISLAKNCCEAMFRGCTSLTEVQSLPATILAECCYREMFMNCTSLTSVPSLPATTLAGGCYVNMFNGCTSLTSAPSLPATTLAISCYASMFNGCTSLTTVPSLPAITLTDNCYSGMFNGCTSLTTAPSLPATTLKSQCYYNMFSGCISLKKIECLATDISATYCTYNWLSGVSAEGKFIKADGMTDWTEGASGIPSGWTVEYKEP